MPFPARNWCSSRRAGICRPTRNLTSTSRFSNPSWAQARRQRCNGSGIVKVPGALCKVQRNRAVAPIDIKLEDGALAIGSETLAYADIPKGKSAMLVAIAADDFYVPGR